MMDKAELIEAALPQCQGIDTLLPEQFGDLFRSTERTPEQRLMLAILEDAIRCWLGVPTALRNDPWMASKRTRLAREADIWLFDDGAKAPISFKTCCGALGIEPEWFRQKLRKIAEAPISDESRSNFTGREDQVDVSCPSLAGGKVEPDEPKRWRQGMSHERRGMRSRSGLRADCALNGAKGSTEITAEISAC
jgi:hypothetical protein